MITYNWSIENLNHRASDNFVTTAHWRCTAQDGDISDSVYGAISFDDGEPVIPYADLTPEEVLSWIWEKENGVDKNETEEKLLEQINLLKNPIEKFGVPWA